MDSRTGVQALKIALWIETGPMVLVWKTVSCFKELWISAVLLGLLSVYFAARSNSAECPCLC